MSDFASAWEVYRARTERVLDARLPGGIDTAPPSRLHQALRYICLNGGKRFRAMLVYACGQTAGAALEQLDTPAAAVEMMHAYSLVHDDLPAMDDDQQRRGQPTCHIAYDEATAILAGDALQTLAFETLCTDSALTVSATRRMRMLKTLARAVGADGMAEGQSLDVQVASSALTLDQLTHIHHLKTGQLIRAAARLGGLTATRVDEKLLKSLDEYATNIGLAFQIVDDILDATTADDSMNQPHGTDQRVQKTTYASLVGIPKARIEARNLCRNASETAAALGDNAAFLQQLAHFVVNRSF